ncbi:MAG: hypothetical protein ACREKE_02340 [bacterium]
MKIASGMVKFAGALGLVLGSLGVLAADQALDMVTLKDGRVVQGEIVAEKTGQIQILVDGVARTYSRDFISRIRYGGDDDASSANNSALVAPGGDALTVNLAARYQVPESSVLWVRQQGITDEDLPRVMAVASAAEVSLRAVTDLRLQGWSWRSIRSHFGLVEPEPEARVVVMEPDPIPLFFRILLFPLFFFGWHGFWR